MPFVQVADVGNDMKLVNETKQKISKVAQPMSVFIPKQSVIVTLQGTIGRVAITQYDAYLDRTVLYFDSYKNSINKNFWSYIIKNKFLEEAKSAPGGTIKTITKEVLSNFDLKMPLKVNEQDKIGDLFTNLDNLITLHQRKFNYILSHKLEIKLFFFIITKNVWEQRKLEEISIRFDNLRVPVSANEREKGTTPYYGANGIQDYVKGFTHNGEYVLIAEDGANDLKNYPVKYVNGLFWANNHVHVVQGKEGICDNKYLKYCFTKTNIESLLVGGGRAKLNANIMMGIDLTVPSFNEQIELGRLFYEIDNLITLHQRKCTYIFYSWEQRKLANLINEYKETVTSDCTLPVLTSSKVDGVVLQEEHFGRKQNHDITGYNILPYGYCTYRNRSDGIDFTFNINKCCKMGIISKFYPVFYGNKNNINLISIILNNSKEVAREIGYTCSGTGQKVLSFLDLQKMNIIIPNRSEQDKISDLFDNLDNLITLHQHKELKRRNDNNDNLRW